MRQTTYAIVLAFTGLWSAGEQVLAADDLPLHNELQGRIPPLRLHCVAADAKVEGFDGDIDAPRPGFTIRGPDRPDNARSIALVLEYGKFRFFSGGNITWNVEQHLAHPRNRVVEVDLFQVSQPRPGVTSRWSAAGS